MPPPRRGAAAGEPGRATAASGTGARQDVCGADRACTGTEPAAGPPGALCNVSRQSGAKEAYCGPVKLGLLFTIQWLLSAAVDATLRMMGVIAVFAVGQRYLQGLIQGVTGIVAHATQFSPA